MISSISNPRTAHDAHICLIVSPHCAQIRKLDGIEPVQSNLRQLWLSYNNLTSLSGIEKLTNLEVLYLSNNKIKDWSEVERLASLPTLRDVLLSGNPIHAKASEEGNWRVEVLKRLLNIKVCARRLPFHACLFSDRGLHSPHTRTQTEAETHRFLFPYSVADHRWETC